MQIWPSGPEHLLLKKKIFCRFGPFSQHSPQFSGKEVIKNHSPLAITSAVKEYATTELGLGASIQKLK